MKAMFQTKVLFLDMPEYPISSNEIRSLCKKREYKKIKNYVPQAVCDYMIKQNLYQENQAGV